MPESSTFNVAMFILVSIAVIRPPSLRSLASEKRFKGSRVGDHKGAGSLPIATLERKTYLCIPARRIDVDLARISSILGHPCCLLLWM
ncbi:hypothetical protein HD554DRAFT_1102451 [Boletus coccyginus]|nr:hypothetical protein HD554DRAFT_1102451 [Boletus coccyginus]